MVYPEARTLLTFNLMTSGAISLLSSLIATLVSTGSHLSLIPAVSWDLYVRVGPVSLSIRRWFSAATSAFVGNLAPLQHKS
jgi:hypothetical protein